MVKENKECAFLKKRASSIKNPSIVHTRSLKEHGERETDRLVKKSISAKKKESLGETMPDQNHHPSGLGR